MFQEIGGNFHLSPDDLIEKEGTQLPENYIDSQKDIVYTSSGRGAISLILNQITCSPRRALLPLYTCQSVILPFIKHGFDISFYDCNKDLSVNEVSFYDKLKACESGLVLFHTYFGFDTIKSLRPNYHELRKKVVIIEDITHSLYSNFPKSGAHYYIASIRKWFAIPDGAVAISTDQEINHSKSGIHEKLVKQNIEAIRLKYQYTKKPEPSLKERYRELFYASEDLLDKDCNFYLMSDISKTILSKVIEKELCESRRRNYLFLNEHLIDHPHVTPVFKKLPVEIIPLYLPVFVNGDRTHLQKYLAEREIYCPIHWPIPTVCKGQMTDNSKKIYNNILSIPCDQRYNLRDMKRIVSVLSKYSNNKVIQI
jgi:dTDP-4-amino-4,6-dideoxygalactose transaminase